MFHPTSARFAGGEDRARQLAEEIARLEERLQDMGMDGDCAYERAMVRLYVDMVDDRRRQLVALLR